MRFFFMLIILIAAVLILTWVLRARISRFWAQSDRRKAIEEQKMLTIGEEQIVDAEAELLHMQEHLAEKRRRAERRGEDDLGT